MLPNRPVTLDPYLDSFLLNIFSAPVPENEEDDAFLWSKICWISTEDLLDPLLGSSVLAVDTSGVSLWLPPTLPEAKDKSLKIVLKF